MKLTKKQKITETGKNRKLTGWNDRKHSTIFLTEAWQKNQSWKIDSAKFLAEILKKQSLYNL